MPSRILCSLLRVTFRHDSETTLSFFFSPQLSMGVMLESCQFIEKCSLQLIAHGMLRTIGFSGLEMEHFLTFSKSLQIQQVRRKVQRPKRSQAQRQTGRALGLQLFSHSPYSQEGEKLPPTPSSLLFPFCSHLSLHPHPDQNCWISMLGF